MRQTSDVRRQTDTCQTRASLNTSALWGRRHNKGLCMENSGSSRGDYDLLDYCTFGMEAANDLNLTDSPGHVIMVTCNKLSP